MAKESKSFFWASYADLMTSLFFVMLTLFIVVIIALNNARIDAIEQTAELQAKIDKADEINNATRELDTQHSQYFQYFPEFKKHKLAVTVNFRSGSADMNSLPSSTKEDLRTTGKILQDFIIKTTQSNVSIRPTTGIKPLYTTIATVTMNLIVSAAIVLLNPYVTVYISYKIPPFALSVHIPDVSTSIYVEVDSKVLLGLPFCDKASGRLHHSGTPLGLHRVPYR